MIQAVFPTVLNFLEKFIQSPERIGKYLSSPSSVLFIYASNEPGGCLQTFGDCREGQMPAALQRRKLDTSLPAAGTLIADRSGFASVQQQLQESGVMVLGAFVGKPLAGNRIAALVVIFLEYIVPGRISHDLDPADQEEHEENRSWETTHITQLLDAVDAVAAYGGEAEDA